MKKMMTLLVALAVLMVASHANAKDATVPDITLQQLESAVQAKQVVLLDCNGTESYSKGHIPGAIDFNANKATLQALLPKQKNALIVAYCGGPGCGMYKQGASAVTALGYTNVKHFSAGIKGWTAANQPTVSGSNPR